MSFGPRPVSGVRGESDTLAETSRVPNPENDPMVTITENNFKTEVLQPAKLVVVFCSADWSAPCRQLAPVLWELEEELSVKFGRLDADTCSNVCATYDVKSVPTLLAFKGGSEVGRRVGASSKSAINSWLTGLQ